MTIDTDKTQKIVDDTRYDILVNKSTMEQLDDERNHIDSWIQKLEDLPDTKEVRSELYDRLIIIQETIDKYNNNILLVTIGSVLNNTNTNAWEDDK